ncbi:MAG: hypothetical protein ACI8YQ_005192 [Polaribacter sp.]|jgi:hypothetical protein
MYNEADLGKLNWDEAVLACESYSGGGYTDWYLPSKEELNLMYTKLYKKELGGFGSDYYWTTTDAGNSSMSCQRFDFDVHAGVLKRGHCLVRAVRAF